MLTDYGHNYDERSFQPYDQRNFPSNEQRSYPPHEQRSYQSYERGYQQNEQQNRELRESRTTVLERGRAIRLMKNGDPYFTGRTFVINQKKYPVLGVFLDDASRALAANFGAVRCVYTPKHGRRLRDISDFEDHHTYVASGGEKFKHLNYYDIAEGKRPVIKGQNSPKLQLPPVRRNESEGRTIKLSRTENLVIYVYRNGDPLTLPAKILLVKSTLNNWENVLDEITRKVLMNNTAVLKLYAMNGELITSAQQLEYNGMYVAAGKERFRRIEYPDPKLLNSSSSPKASRKLVYPPVRIPPQPVKTDARFPRQPPILHLKQRYAKSDGNNTNTTNTNSYENVGHSGPSRRPRREENEFFNQKPLQHRRGPPREVDLDRDDGGIYKNRSSYRDRPREIDDTYETKVEIPVDHREPEIVDDEDLYGNVERTPRRHHPMRTKNYIPTNARQRVSKSPSSQPYNDYNELTYTKPEQNGNENGRYTHSRTPNNYDQPIDSSPFEPNEYDYKDSHSKNQNYDDNYY